VTERQTDTLIAILRTPINQRPSKGMLIVAVVRSSYDKELKTKRQLTPKIRSESSGGRECTVGRI